jgi:hypothetical protein
MRNEAFRTMALTAVLCGAAGLAMARDPGFHPGTPVEFQTTVNAVRVVPEGNPLPGLHIDAKVKGQLLDIYIAPMTFVTKYGMTVEKGAIAVIQGTQIEDSVLARSITTGVADKVHGTFHPDLTIYLRDDSGPFWVDDTQHK